VQVERLAAIIDLSLVGHRRVGGVAFNGAMNARCADPKTAFAQGGVTIKYLRAQEGDGKARAVAHAARHRVGPDAGVPQVHCAPERSNMPPKVPLAR